MTLRIATIGECMIEILEPPPGVPDTPLRRTFGGDTFNTAVYLARELRGEDAVVDFVTALGDDFYSTEMRAFFARHGVGDRHALTVAGALPGLYTIRIDSAGERSFLYWRGESAARRLFEAPGIDAVETALAGYDLVYVSGITLAILPADGRARLLALARRVRDAGRLVAFDPNYRPRLWPDRAGAATAIEAGGAVASIVLPTFDDDRALFGDAEPEASCARWTAAGAPEVVVKCGADETLLCCGDAGIARVAPPQPIARPVDTTAAGDSFNAAYLAARLTGAAPDAAAVRGHALAARVIMHSGAIVPDIDR